MESCSACGIGLEPGTGFTRRSKPGALFCATCIQKFERLDQIRPRTSGRARGPQHASIVDPIGAFMQWIQPNRRRYRR